MGDHRLLRVMVAYVLSSVVLYAAWVAVLLYAFARGGASLAGIAAVVQLLPAAVLVPLLGSLGDRWPRGTALQAAYASEAASLGLLAVLLMVKAPIATVLISAAVATVAISLVRPFHFAALPQLAEAPSALVSANSACGIADGVGGFAGPVLAGLVSQSGGPWMVAFVSSLAMLVAAWLTRQLGLPAAGRMPEATHVPVRRLTGLRQMSVDRAVLALLLLGGISFVVNEALEVLALSFAGDVLGKGASAAGLLVGAVGIGGMIGAAAAAGLAFRVRLAGPTTVGLAIAGAPLVLMATASGLPSAVLLLALCGSGQAFAAVAGRTLLQRSTDDRVLAGVFALQEGLMMGGLACGAALAPLLVKGFGPADGYLPLGAGLAGLAILAWPLLRRLDARAVVRVDVLALLRRVPFLGAMAPPALQKLSQHAEWIALAADEVVVREGQPGDAFYILDTGRVSVEIAGSSRTRTLVPVEGFGEIALLRNVGRTATITTLEPSRLLRLRREDFLAAITGNPDGVRLAEQVAESHLARDLGGP
jgi:MFS family permease